MVKQGVKDQDNDSVEIGGWQGRIVEMDNGGEDTPVVLVEWDSPTLREMPQPYIEESLENGRDWSSMYLDASVLTPAFPRDTPGETEAALVEVTQKCIDSLIPPAAQDALVEYTRIRGEFNALHNDAMKSVTKEEMGRAGKQLGILQGDNIFAFDSKKEVDVLADFTLYELRREGLPIIQCYLRDKPDPGRGGGLVPTIAGALGSLMRKNKSPDIDIVAMNEAVSQSFTSLFQIAEVAPAGVELVDLLNAKRPPCLLIDIGLINTAQPKMLIFSRLLPFRDFHITGGAACCFPAHRREHLLRSYWNAVKGRSGHRLEVERYRFFHRANRRFGLEM
jgi:hypothetical protein